MCPLSFLYIFVDIIFGQAQTEEQLNVFWTFTHVPAYESYPGRGDNGSSLVQIMLIA